MEVEAKEFAAAHGDSFEKYYQNGEWNFPTEMGIMSGQEEYNRGINKADYLSKDMEILKWRKEFNQETNSYENQPYIYKHKAYYSFDNK